jgi:hypothetical protein
MKSCTIEQAQEAQTKMHRAIIEAVDMFSEATGLTVRNIELSVLPIKRMDKETLLPHYAVGTEILL